MSPAFPKSQDEFLIALWRLYRAVDVWQQSDGDDDAYDAMAKAYRATQDAEMTFIGSVFAAGEPNQ